MNRISLLALAAGLAFGGTAVAANIVIDVVDGPGVGFNDNSAADPYAPGNTGTTIGEQRLQVFERAAQIWGARLVSSVTITVSASFADLECAGSTAVLGSAGPSGFFSASSGLPLADTWYPIPLINALTDGDQNGADPEIGAEFNGQLDSGTCLTDVQGWYYGLDRSAPPPADRIALLPVVLHELGHGFGFLTITDLATGAFASGGGGPQPDIWAGFQFDLAESLSWLDMNNAQRQGSAIGDPNLAWDGPAVNAALADVLRPPGMLTVDAPPVLAADYPAESAGSAFGIPPPPGGLSGELVQSADGNASGSTFDACDPITNPGELDGKIAFVDRGNCTFSTKARNVEAAGAIGLVVADLNGFSVPAPFVMSGDYDITIPGVIVTVSLGDDLFVALQGGTVEVTLGFNGAQPLQGTNGGLVRLYAPDPLETGSSVSHFTVDALPDLLMEPSISPTIFDRVDLSLPLLEDIGWNTLPEPPLAPEDIFADGFESNP